MKTTKKDIRSAHPMMVKFDKALHGGLVCGELIFLEDGRLGEKSALGVDMLAAASFEAPTVLFPLESDFTSSKNTNVILHDRNFLIAPNYRDLYHIKKEIRRVASKGGKVFMIDSLQRIRGFKEGDGKEKDRFSFIEPLFDMAVSLNICIILVDNRRIMPPHDQVHISTRSKFERMSRHGWVDFSDEHQTPMASLKQKLSKFLTWMRG